MKYKFLKLFCALLIGVLNVGFVSCGDDGDEPNDPNMPESGTWTISSYDNLSMRFESCSVDRDHWSLWENEFNKEINKRKIKINKNTPVEDGWYILSTDDERDNIGYRHDLEKIEVISIEGKSMTANYYLKQYLSVMSDDDYIIFQAEIKLNRK